jgi:hypothetical protein
MSNIDPESGMELLLPGVDDVTGTISNDWNTVYDRYKRTGRHLGKFKTAADADKYAELLHLQGAGQWEQPTRWQGPGIAGPLMPLGAAGRSSISGDPDDVLPLTRYWSKQ